jgi:hypothetical protein
LKAETLGIRPGHLRPWKKPRGLQHRAVGVTDGTLDALVDIRFHFSFFSPQRHGGHGERFLGKIISKTILDTETGFSIVELSFTSVPSVSLW